MVPQNKHTQASLDADAVSDPVKPSQRVGRRCVVMKFGGTSVVSLKHWQTMAQLLQTYRKQGYFCVVVCSAMASVSNEIEAMIADALEGKEFVKAALDRIKKRHWVLLKELSLSEDVLAADFVEFASLLAGLSLTRDDSPSLRARLMAKGEFLLTRVGHAYLQASGLNVDFVDVRDWLVARMPVNTTGYDQQHILSAACDYEYSPDLVEACEKSDYDAVITQGFVAKDHRDRTVLLGRGGSDTSAAYLAAKLAAERLEIWTDVPGIFTANPSVIPSSRLLLKLGYDEAQELASSGASVLHPRCIEPLRSASIPLEIRWTEQPNQQQRTSVGKVGSSFPCVKGVCIKKDVYVLSMESLGMWQETGFLADLFAVFKRFHMSVNTVSTSESNVTVTLDSESQVLEKPQLVELVEALGQVCKPKIYSGCVSISLVGKHIRSILHRIAPVFIAFEDKKVFVVSQAANDLNMSFTIEAKEASKLLRYLHDLLFSHSELSDIFGSYWHDLVGVGSAQPLAEKFSRNEAVVESPSSWWLAQVQTLQNIQQLSSQASAVASGVDAAMESEKKKTEQKTGEKKLSASYTTSHTASHTTSHIPYTESSSTYVYHVPTVAKKLADLQGVSGVDRIFYALKANYHSGVISYLYENNVGFDCVSVGELDYLRSQLPQWDGTKIIFTPNFPEVSEYAYAYDLGVRVTLDSMYPLEAYPQIFRGRQVMLRFDPGVGKGHHDHVKTAGNRSKFGISTHDWQKCVDICERNDITIFGLHAHLGSGITSAESWGQSASYLASLAADLKGDIRVLDVGGGFAVPAKPSDSSLSMTMLSEVLASFKEAHPQFELWIEPGRYLVAEAGVLLSTVTQVKYKGAKTFVGVNAGMHVLLRPSLYGAYHQVVNLSKLDQPLSMTADVVGPICESGDVIGYDRFLPHTEPGDILLVACSGAYGSVMGMNYNLRAGAKEVLISEHGKVVRDDDVR